jgi:hypothetical protein
MSGIEKFNFPEFHRVSKLLRSQGWDIVSPAELDEAESEAAAMASATGDPAEMHRSWGHYLSRDIQIITDARIEAIVFLPDWENSRGARLEASVGLLCKTRFFRVSKGDEVWELKSETVASALFKENMRTILQKELLT